MGFVENKCKQKGSDDSIFKCRYIVALLGFFCCFEINAYRIATSMSLVVMVNTTAFSLNEVVNNSTVSCPLNFSDGKDHKILKMDGEFEWSPTIQGYILGSGFLGYVFALTPGGMLAETYGAKRIVLLGLFLSSGSHLISPFCAWSSSSLMIAIQLLRGLTQGLIPAALSVISTNWFPKCERGFLNSLVYLGFSFGMLIGGYSSSLMCSSPILGGWSSVYYIYGALGFFLSLCFHVFVFESPKCHPRISKEELAFILKNQESDFSLKRPPTPWKSILTSVEVYAMVYAIFAVYWVVSHFSTIQPIFLGTILHFSIEENGFFTSIPFLFQVIFTFIGSWMSKWLNMHNYVGVDKVRKGSNMIYCLGYSLCLFGVYFTGCQRVLSASLSAAALAFLGFSLSGCFITPFDMSPTFAGSLTGFSSTVGSLACFIFPVLVGILTDEKQTLEEWNIIFFISIGIILSSGIIFCVFGSAEVQPWNYSNSEQVSKPHPKENVKNISEEEISWNF